MEVTCSRCGEVHNADDVRLEIEITLGAITGEMACPNCQPEREAGVPCGLVISYIAEIDRGDILRWLLTHGSPTADGKGLKALHLLTDDHGHRWGPSAWGPDRHPNWGYTFKRTPSQYGVRRASWMLQGRCPHCYGQQGEQEPLHRSMAYAKDSLDAEIISALIDVLQAMR